jgi:CheY-like chemotaxis protein
MAAESISARVLIVDDDEMSRELLGVLLQAKGYTVATAESGDAALATLGQGGPAPDLVLADVQMPGISGAELAAGLRRVGGSNTLLLAMSGSKPAKAAIAGFDGFLLKPFKMDAIAAALVGRNLNAAGEIHSPAAENASKLGMRNSVQDAPTVEPAAIRSASSSPTIIRWSASASRTC